MYYIYMIKNKAGKLYVGVSQNLKQRLYYHNTKQGAKFTKLDNKFHFVFCESYNSLAEARKREVQIKNWRRDKKEVLIKKFSSGQETRVKL